MFSGDGTRLLTVHLHCLPVAVKYWCLGRSVRSPKHLIQAILHAVRQELPGKGNRYVLVNHCIGISNRQRLRLSSGLRQPRSQILQEQGHL
jgi:hypothetical protein